MDFINKYIRRLKALHKDPASLLADSKNMKLTKYISEIAQTVVLENKLTTPKDAATVLELAALLHQRYDDFVHHLVRRLLQAYKEIPAKLGAVAGGGAALLGATQPQGGAPGGKNQQLQATEVGVLASRRKMVFKMLTDLFLQGFLKEYKSIYSCLRELMQPESDKQPALFSLNLQTLAWYLKLYHWPLFRWLSATRQGYLAKLKLADKFKAKPGLLPEKRCAELRQLFARYYSQRGLKFFELQLRELKEAEFFAESSDSRPEKEKVEGLRAEFAKLREAMDTLADVLGVEAEHKKAIEEEVKQKGKNILDVEEELTLIAHKKYWPFDDRHEWRFYRRRARLQDELLPGYEPGFVESRYWRQAERGVEAAAPPAESERASDEKLSSEMEFLARRLNACESKAEADEVAALFYSKFNTKDHKHRLPRVLLGAPRQQLSLLPLYCRFLANLSFDLPKVADRVLEGLKDDLHRRLRDLKFLEEKTRNIRYLAELTKFQLVSPGEIVDFLRE